MEVNKTQEIIQNFEDKIKLSKELNSEKFNEFKLREIKKKRKEESEIDMEGEKKEIWLKKIKCVFNKKILIKLKEKNIK